MATSSDKEIKDIKTFVFLDLEATGLPSEGRPRITEISLVSIHHTILHHWQDRDEVPRLINKLVYVVCPMKPVSSGATDITGLCNEDLEYQKDFDHELVKTVGSFLERHEKPVCLLAHNGNGFDFSLLRSEYVSLECSLPADLLCVDTLVMLRELQEGPDEPVAQHIACGFDEENKSPSPISGKVTGIQAIDSIVDNVQVWANRTPKKNSLTNQKNKDKNYTTPAKKPKTQDHMPSTDGKVNKQLIFSPEQPSLGRRPYKSSRQYKYSYKLPEVHRRVVGYYPVNSHLAEDDCIALLRICQKLAPDVRNWSNRNAIPINSVDPMYPKSPRKRKVLKTGVLPYTA